MRWSARHLRLSGICAPHAFDDQLVMAIEGFLNEADRVKFAKFAPRDYLAREAMDGVRGIVSILVTPSVTQEEAK